MRQRKELVERNTRRDPNEYWHYKRYNGPQGHISARTVASVAPLEWGLQKIVQQFATIQLKSCMTLDVENCHSTVHIKQVNMSMMEYARSFKFTMKESVKKATQWAAFHHTSRKYGSQNQRRPYHSLKSI